jgi:hypothetical protein
VRAVIYSGEQASRGRRKVGEKAGGDGAGEEGGRGGLFVLFCGWVCVRVNEVGFASFVLFN